MKNQTLHRQLEELHPLSYGWAVSCCRGDREAARDVLQASYLKVLEGRAVFSGQSTFKTWFFAVIRMTSLELQRKIARRLDRLRSVFETQPPRGRQSGLEDRLAGDQLQNLMENRLGRLSRRQQEVLHLTFYQELTLEQAATVMGVSLGSARTHYHRGKQALRKAFEDQETEYGTAPLRQPNQDVL